MRAAMLWYFAASARLAIAPSVFSGVLGRLSKFSASAS